MQVEAEILPMAERLNLISDNAATRFLKLEQHHTILQRLPSTWRHGAHPEHPHPFPHTDPDFNVYRQKLKAKSSTSTSAIS